MNVHLQISSVRHTPTHVNRTHRAFAGYFCSLALILGSALMCQAQTPTPCPADVQATRQGEETLDPMYQPSHYDPADHTVMHRYRFRPSGTGPWPNR
jgi:hypothetical protein